MNDRLQTLQCLIENRIFFPSASSFSLALGYKGKMMGYRLLKGQISEKLISEIWDKLLNKYRIDENVLYDLANICIITKDFSSIVIKEMNTEHPEWVENVIMSVVDSCYDYYSDEFRNNTAPILIEMKNDDPDILWGIITLFYIRAKKIEIYSKNNISTICNIIHELDCLLYSMHPEKINAHQVAGNLITVLKLNNKTASIWTLIFNSIILFRYYTETNFIRTAAKSSVLFDWPSRSYWIMPGSAYKKDAEVLLLVQNNLNTASNGIYIAVCLKAGNNIEEFIPQYTYILQFMFPENTLFVTRMNNGHKEMCVYKYDYDSEQKTLKFEPYSNTDGWNMLPDVLYRIDSFSIDSVSEKVWWRILEKFDKNGYGRETYNKAIEKFTGITDLSAQYMIKDININRNVFSMELTVSGEKSIYQIPIERYSFLSEINPSEYMIITRHELDDDIYVEWPYLGYAIKLSEFEKL